MFKLGKLPYFKALFPAVTMDIRLHALYQKLKKKTVEASNAFYGTVPRPKSVKLNSFHLFLTIRKIKIHFIVTAFLFLTRMKYISYS